MRDKGTRGQTKLLTQHGLNAPLPLTALITPNAQYPTSNDSIDLGSIVEKNKCLRLYLTSAS
ncbi:hypothetical protein [Nostoc sp. C117]|uniref:hypothetical protein n=1 Tax=Nostoc sp. C117 TaxID=3349875 RepID=UPI00370DBB86